MCISTLWNDGRYPIAYLTSVLSQFSRTFNDITRNNGESSQKVSGVLFEVPRIRKWVGGQKKVAGNYLLDTEIIFLTQTTGGLWFLSWRISRWAGGISVDFGDTRKIDSTPIGGCIEYFPTPTPCTIFTKLPVNALCHS